MSPHSLAITLILRAQWDKTMAYKLLNIPNDDTQNYPSCRLQFVVGTFGHLTKPTNQNLLKTPKMLSQRLRKDYQNHLGTSVINSPLSPSFLLILQLYSGKIFLLGAVFLFFNLILKTLL